MIEKMGWTRRMVLAAKAALAGGLSLPGTAFAAARSGTAQDAAIAKLAPARWPTATAEEMQAFVGQRFRVRTQEHGTLAIRLIDVESPASDPARPAHLPRRVGLSAMFDGPDADLLGPLGDGMQSISHPRIGTTDAFLKPIARPNGGYQIEMILN